MGAYPDNENSDGSGHTEQICAVSLEQTLFAHKIYWLRESLNPYPAE